MGSPEFADLFLAFEMAITKGGARSVMHSRAGTDGVLSTPVTIAAA